MSVLPPRGPPSIHEERSSGDSERSSSSSKESSSMNLDEPQPDDDQNNTPTATSLDIPPPAPLDAHQDARALVRTIQCFCCSLPLRSPVTLPCGESICQQCIPPTFLRENVTYPAAPERRQGFKCPFSKCGQDHPLEDVSLNVMLQQLMETVKTQVALHLSTANDKQTVMEEYINLDASEDAPEQPLREKGHSKSLPGGRLVATYGFAESGELHYLSDVIYHDEQEPAEEDRTGANTFLDDLTRSCMSHLECHVCYNLMLDPVTTPCGHTFCRKCLARILDHSSLCAVCRRELPLPPSLSRQASNKVMVTLLQSLYPEQVRERAEAVAQEELTAPGGLDTPIFVCATCFPGMPFMLHVFEPRYRLMIRRALATNGRFGMVAYNGRHIQQGNLGYTHFMDTGTVLQIEGYQLLPDGRSYLMCRGVSRFKLLAHGMMDGYVVGRIQQLEDISLAEEEQIEADETRVEDEEASHPQQQQQPQNSQDQQAQEAQEAMQDPQNSSAAEDMDVEMQEGTNLESELSPRRDTETAAEPETMAGSEETPATSEPTTTAQQPPSQQQQQTTIPIDRQSTSQLFERCQDFIREAQAQSAPWLQSRITQAHGEPPTDPATFPYWFASVLPLSEDEKYKLLPTTSVRERLKITAKWVERIESQRWFRGSACTLL